MSLSVAPLKNVLVVGAGGTISIDARSEIDRVNYADEGADRFSTLELLEAIPGVTDLANLEPMDLAPTASTKLGTSYWVELRTLLEQQTSRADPPDGIVITHGTATLEETAYFLHLSFNSRIPLVLTGSLRPLSVLGSDASFNLLDAVRVAAHPDAQGAGVLAVMNGMILGAREVSKTRTHALDSFASPASGPLGRVDADGAVRFEHLPRRRHTYTSLLHNIDAPLPDVGIAYSYLGSGREVAAAVKDDAVQGLVLAALPPGFPTWGEEVALVSRDPEFPVVVASRTGGQVLSSVRLERLGVVPAGDLSPQKARVLLMLSLAAGFRQRAAIQHIVDTH